MPLFGESAHNLVRQQDFGRSCMSTETVQIIEKLGMFVIVLACVQTLSHRKCDKRRKPCPTTRRQKNNLQMSPRRLVHPFRISKSPVIYRDPRPSVGLILSSCPNRIGGLTYGTLFRAFEKLVQLTVS